MMLMSSIALSITALTLFLVGTALFVEPTRVLVLYAQNEALRLNALAIDLARLVGVLLFALAAVAFILLGVRHNESRASLCFAFAYVFFFATLAHALSAIVDHGTWAKGLARAPFEPVYVLYVRYYAPLTLAVINFIAAWCDDISDDDAAETSVAPPAPVEASKSKPE
jgi:hypothetical protein